MKNFIQALFSIKNNENKTHKIITILGITIKIKRKKKQEKNNTDIWLDKNRILRMDANRSDLFDKTRCDFHIDRYRLACEYTEDKIVLDCASGTGYGANELKVFGRAKYVIGIEYDKEAVEYANNLYASDSVSFKEGSILNLPLEDNSIDIFTSFETIEHIENEKQQLEEVKRVLKPNGLYILSTPNDWDNKNNPYHVRSYTYHSLQKALQDFDIIKIYNQISGSHPNTKREIYLTNEENYKFAECFIVICRNIK